MNDPANLGDFENEAGLGDRLSESGRERLSDFNAGCCEVGELSNGSSVLVAGSVDVAGFAAEVGPCSAICSDEYAKWLLGFNTLLDRSDSAMMLEPCR